MRKVIARDWDQPDNEIVAAAKRGDRAARQALFDRHFDMASRLALQLTGRRMEAEEIVQDAFVQALSSLRKLRSDDAFRMWFTRIVVSSARRHLRRQILLRRLGLLDYVPLDITELSEQAQSAEDQVDIRRLYEVLDTLPEGQRIVIVMRHIEGRQIDDISALVGRARATVKRWLAQGEETARKRALAGRPAAVRNPR